MKKRERDRKHSCLKCLYNRFKTVFSGGFICRKCGTLRIDDSEVEK